jgi:hemerythrin
MSFLEWNTSFELGIKEFDEHHKQLVHLLNEAYGNFLGEANHETLEDVLDKLIDYATYHFTAEEHWMGLHGYPGLQKHREEHNLLSRTVVEIQFDFNKDRKHLSIEVLVFLKEWLSNHILQTDADYGRFAAQYRQA